MKNATVSTIITLFYTMYRAILTRGLSTNIRRNRFAALSPASNFWQGGGGTWNLQSP